MEGDPKGILTPRELEVLRLAEYPNKEIARRLGISLGTVRNYWSGIYRALGRGPIREGRKTKAVVAALEMDVIQIEEIEEGDRRCSGELY